MQRESTLLFEFSLDIGCLTLLDLLILKLPDKQADRPIEIPCRAEFSDYLELDWCITNTQFELIIPMNGYCVESEVSAAEEE